MPTQTFSASGNFTVPTGVTQLTSVECWAASGGGSTFAATGRGGGGGGQYAKEVSVSVTPGAVIPIVVGTGGGLDTDGGDSYYNDGTVVKAKGGKGASNRTGGAGNQAGSIGTTKYNGGNGATSTGAAAGGGGGGSTAGTTGNGNNGTANTGGTGGPGGTAPTGGFAGAAGANNTVTGNTAANPGGGGGGGGAGMNSGSGGNGQVVLTWVSPPTIDAGVDKTVYSGSAATMAASGTNYTSLLWTTPGDGTFDDATLTGPVYTPGTNDRVAGSVILTCTATGTGSPATDTATVYIVSNATTNTITGRVMGMPGILEDLKAGQTSQILTDSYVEISGSKMDAQQASFFSYSVQVADYGATVQLRAACLADYSDEVTLDTYVIAVGNAGIPSRVNSDGYYPGQEANFPYYRLLGKNTVAGSASVVKARGFKR